MQVSGRGGRCLIAVIAIILVIGLSFFFWNTQLSEYAQGYKEGVKVVREARKEAGFIADPLVALAVLAGLPRNDKSADWNAGFRAGISDELNNP